MTHRYERLAEESSVDANGALYREHPLLQDLDVFFTRVYEYYVHGGARNYALSRIAYACKYALTLSLLFVLLECVDYDRLASLLEASSSTEHIEMSQFVYWGAGGKTSFFTVLLFVGFGLYFAWLCLRTVRDVHVMFAVGSFYHKVLRMSYTEVQTCEWNEVCQRMLRAPQLQRRMQDGRLRQCSELDIANRVMRRQNYLIALLNLNVLAWPCGNDDDDEVDDNSGEHAPPQAWKRWMTAPWNPLFVTRTDLSPIRERNHPHSRRPFPQRYRQQPPRQRRVARPPHLPHPVFTRTLEWALHYGLFIFVFDARSGRLRRELESTARYSTLKRMAHTLRWRFRVMSVLGFLLCPFVLVYVLFDFFLEHGEQFRNRPQHTLSTRRWSIEAQWMLREFNELPHLFQRRLNAAHEHAAHYLSHFTSATTTIVARFIAYCCGSFVAVLLLLAFVGDDDALTRVNVAWSRSGVWWLTVFGVILAAARSAIPPDNAVHNPSGHMRHCVRHTHYMPASWRGREHTGAVRDRFARLFEYRWWQCVREMLSILYTPYLLWTVLPARAEALMLFFRDYSVPLDGCGHVCRFAAFSLARDGDPRYGARQQPSDVTTEDHAEDSTSISASESVAYSAHHGKMETSVLSFRGDHPRWQPPMDSGCEQFIRRIRSQQDLSEQNLQQQQQQRQQQQQKQPSFDSPIPSEDQSKEVRWGDTMEQLQTWMAEQEAQSDESAANATV